MSSLPRDPLALTTRLIVDGTNLLHALARGTDRQPAATLIGRLRALVPAGIAIDLVFDGPPERGLRGERIAAGLRVRYAGTRSADELILSLVEEVRAVDGPDGTAGILVVSDDRGLRQQLRARGARSAGADWLRDRLSRTHLASPSSGNARPPIAAPEDDGDAEARWQPGRGATAKRGPSRRSARRRRPTGGGATH